MAEITEKRAPNTVETSTPTTAATKKSPGLTFRRLFTKLGVSPYDEIE
jgi:hypothetical protein